VNNTGCAFYHVLNMAVIIETSSRRKTASPGNLESVLLLKLHLNYFKEQVEVLEIHGRVRMRKSPPVQRHDGMHTL
jgi:hypothetical protein